MPKIRELTQTPPMAEGDAEAQVDALRDYLLRITEELTYLLTHLEADNINDSTFERIAAMIPKAAVTAPPMDGEGSAGSSDRYARADHQHHEDTNKADLTALTEHTGDHNNPHAVNAAQVPYTGSLGTGSVKYMLETVAGDIPAVPLPYDGTPETDGEADPGDSTEWARGNHRHGTDTSRAAASALTAHTGDHSNPHEVSFDILGAPLLTMQVAELLARTGTRVDFWTDHDGNAFTDQEGNGLVLRTGPMLLAVRKGDM